MKCSVESCDRDAKCKGLCMAHYLRQRYFGGLNPEKPIGARSGKFGGMWKGGTFKTVDGRVMIMAKDHPYPNHLSGYVYRYRLVMEKHLGRILLPSELVHHKNHIVDDDRIENLEVTSRADHINHHRPELTKSRLANGWNRKGRIKRAPPHECRESKTCCCSMTALEPDEECPVHSAGPWPPRCEICGQFMKRKEQLESYQ